MGPKRTAYLVGHTPKFLVIVDDTAESDRALYFAAKRAARLKSGVVLAAINVPEDVGNWFRVGDVMREEAEEKAREILTRAAARARAISGVEPDIVIREGQPAEEIRRLIDEDLDISTLVLAAGTGKEGPGPLVSTLAGKSSGAFPVPIAVIPGSLDDEELDAITG